MRGDGRLIDAVWRTLCRLWAGYALRVALRVVSGVESSACGGDVAVDLDRRSRPCEWRDVCRTAIFTEHETGCAPDRSMRSCYLPRRAGGVETRLGAPGRDHLWPSPFLMAACARRW